MRRTLAAAALAGALAAGAQERFDDSGIRVAYAPENLWRSGSGGFVGRVEDGTPVLVLDFFGDDGPRGRYAPCPSRTGAESRAPSCEEIQRAVEQSFQMWAAAARRLVVRRRRDPSESVNIWVAWTDAFEGERPPVAQSIDNGRRANPEEPSSAPGFGGFDRPAFPDLRKSSGALLFNDRYCWRLDEDACPPGRVLPNGKSVSNTRPVKEVALHEAGHVLGLLHFAHPSIMGLAGGTERYELTAYDRMAIRVVYSRFADSLGLPRRP